jgi:2,4-dienoyl-CoA reductase-like NADH-dependent reductase (Old Yellow Enzyme family)
MHPIHHPIFDSLRLSGQSLKNRLVVAPMTRTSATEAGVPTADMAAYYEAFARGGFAAIITEGTYTDTVASQANPGQPGLVNQAQLRSWKPIVQRVKQHGALFIAQLMHGGALSQYHTRTLAPSAIQPLGKKMPEAGGGDGPFPFPQEITLSDLRMIRQGFVNAALLAKEAGFDGIELHAANGYLLDQFLTEYTNQRQDQYGGTVENRFRLIGELIAEIRQGVGENFLIGLRLSEGKVNHLSYRFPEGSAMAKAILGEVARTKIDYVHIAAEGGKWARECLYPDGSSYSGLARQITGLPVIANGGLHDLNVSRQLLQEGHADLVALGRAALADPNWPTRIRSGEQPLAFHLTMIKPSVTIQHAQEVIAALRKGEHAGASEDVHIS